MFGRVLIADRIGCASQTFYECLKEAKVSRNKLRLTTIIARCGRTYRGCQRERSVTSLSRQQCIRNRRSIFSLLDDDRLLSVRKL